MPYTRIKIKSDDEASPKLRELYQEFRVLAQLSDRFYEAKFNLDAMDPYTRAKARMNAVKKILDKHDKECTDKKSCDQLYCFGHVNLDEFEDYLLSVAQYFVQQIKDNDPDYSSSKESTKKTTSRKTGRFQ